MVLQGFPVEGLILSHYIKLAYVLIELFLRLYVLCEALFVTGAFYEPDACVAEAPLVC
jgi:hypothetical protein